MKSFKILVAFMMAVVCVGLSSCSKDDDEKVGSSNHLVGKWELTQVKGWMLDEDGNKEQVDEVRGDLFYVFNSNGTGLTYEVSEGDPDIKFTWKLSGNSLTMSMEGEATVFQVEKLDESALIMSLSEDNESYTATLKKIAN